MTEYSYYPNGKLQSMKNEAGKATTYSYDRCWRVQTVASETQPAAAYSYDSAGRVAKQVLSPRDGEGEDLATSYTYDCYGHVASETDPAGNVTQYRYDGNGNLVETEDAAGRVSYSRYDALNRVVETGIYVKKEGAEADPLRTVLTRTFYDIKAHTVTETDAVNGGTAITPTTPQAAP